MSPHTYTVTFHIVTDNGVQSVDFCMTDVLWDAISRTPTRWPKTAFDERGVEVLLPVALGSFDYLVPESLLGKLGQAGVPAPGDDAEASLCRPLDDRF